MKVFSNAGEAFSQRVTSPFANAGSFAAPSAETAPSGEVQVASVPNDLPPGRLKRARNAYGSFTDGLKLSRTISTSIVFSPTTSHGVMSRKRR